MTRSRIFLAALFVAAALSLPFLQRSSAQSLAPTRSSTNDPKIVYPVTKKVEQVDDYFGTKVYDPYRWLEDETSAETKAWVDEQNRLWFAEYGGNGIGMFDPKTDAIKEWRLPTPWSAPYDVVAIKNGAEVWTGSMLTDRVSRLDTATGEVVDYLLPRTTNIRRVFVDDTGARPVLWVGSNHGSTIVKVEPLD